MIPLIQVGHCGNEPCLLYTSIVPSKAVINPKFNISHKPINTNPTDLSCLNSKKITAVYNLSLIHISK